MKAAFYEGSEWMNELEPVVMPMIDSYSVVLTEAASWSPAAGVNA